MKLSLLNWQILLCVIKAVTAESYYSINAPGVIKSNRKFSVVVALHEASAPASIRVGIEGPGFKEFRDVNLQPYEMKIIEFLPNKLISGNYSLKAEGLSGLKFRNVSSLLEQTDYGAKIYVQTDKAIYKPQDIINFRVVILDEHTRPLDVVEPVHVEILDREGIRVKQFKDIWLTKGVYTGKFKLSKYPALGNWKIKVVLGGKYAYSTSKTIKVSNYVLPKFSVHLKTPSNIVLKDGYIKVVIFGKYTFDKYVEGNATIELWNDKNVLLQTKYIDVEKLAFVEFNIKNEENLNNICRLNVRAKLTEQHTGRTETESQSILLHSDRYALQIPFDDIEFDNNKPYRLKVYVKHWTGAPVLDYNTPVTMEHGGKVYEAYLNEKGAATFEFEHSKNEDHKFQFKDSKAMLNNIYTSDNLMLNKYCQLKLLDKKLRLGKPVEIEVSSITNIPYLMYIIVGHASLIHAKHIKIPANQKSIIISITPSIEMIPVSFIYAYYVHNGNLHYDEMRLQFPFEFENQISLSAPKQAKPGAEVTLKIDAQPTSYVSVLAVDLGVALLDNSYDLKKSFILSDLLNEQSYSPIAATVYPGLTSGLLTLTNAHFTFENLPGHAGAEPYRPPSNRVRDTFPETWIFENFFITETSTKFTLPIPDTVTTWRITAFSNNDVTGFGIVDRPTDITTIQPFFISLNLPYSVKRGEILIVPISVFNYHNQSLNTEVVLYNSDQEFHFMESKLLRTIKSKDDQQQIKNINIPMEKAKTVNFLIYPVKSGEISLRVRASNSLYADAVVQKLKIEPEGVFKQQNQAKYLSIPAGEKITTSLGIQEPAERVPDSDYITFSVGGHYLVPTVENLHDLIQIPSGCGEQNMVNFAPSVLILQYLKVNGKLSKEKNLVDSLRSLLEAGYQQQLSFRHANGGYSIFGMDTDEEPSTWLTAYVVRYFIKALQFLEIEEKIIESGLEYLAGQQMSNGEFPYTGYLLNPRHQNEYGLTAFILLAFLEDQKYAAKYRTTIQNGVEYLTSHLNMINDIYEISLVAFVIKRAKHQTVHSLINQLDAQCKEDNGLKWWSGNDNNLASDIEITAYAAIALLDTPGDHTSILKWLIEQRNANGGFTSSHDTVVGMEALVKFSEKYKNLSNLYLKISYSAKDQDGTEVASDEFYVNPNNILDLQKHELPETTRHVTFEMEGNGASLVQLNHQYNILDIKDLHHFHIQPKPVFKNPKEMNLEICFSYQPDSGSLNEATNMVIMEANLPSGFTHNSENSLRLIQNEQVLKIESKSSRTTIVLYLDKLKANADHCLDILADKTTEILMPKPAAIIMYDYYNLSRANTVFYSL